MRVLQVEDDPTTAQSVEQMLKSVGYECHTTALGEEAVRLAQKDPYDVILLDIMLPDIDGYEVLKRLQDWDIGTPVVIQSGQVEDARDAAGLGFETTLLADGTRPVNIEPGVGARAIAEMVACGVKVE